MRICNEKENISSIKELWELTAKTVTRIENGTQSIFVTVPETIKWNQSDTTFTTYGGNENIKTPPYSIIAIIVASVLVILIHMWCSYNTPHRLQQLYHLGLNWPKILCFFL